MPRIKVTHSNERHPKCCVTGRGKEETLMTKLFLFKLPILVLFILLIQLGNQSKANASDIYMGEYSNGQIAYLDTSSIRTHNHYTQGCHEGDNIVV